jgi:hypothetical protein
MYRPRFNYRSGAPGGSRRTAIARGEKSDPWNFGAASGRTLLRDNRKPWQKHGGYEEDNSGMRDLRKLPASIADGACD